MDAAIESKHLNNVNNALANFKLGITKYFLFADQKVYFQFSENQFIWSSCVLRLFLKNIYLFFLLNISKFFDTFLNAKA